MVVPEPEMVSPGGEVVESSPFQADLQRQQQEANNHALSSLGRQSSIYSLTLDEFQHTLCERGKNFGSMNMDEFLASIWTAEENQNQASYNTNSGINTGNHGHPNRGSSYEIGWPRDVKPISTQSSLPRQGSLTLPAPLCRKTVDEVWSEIHGNGQGQQGQGNIDVSSSGGGNTGNPDSAQGQRTFGEMTLEDFLIKAGVVREQQGRVSPPMPTQQHQYDLYQGGNGNANSGFVSGTVPGVATGGGVSYTPPSQAGVYGGRAGNGGGGYMAAGGMVGPMSPVSNSDAMVVVGGADGVGNQDRMDMGGLRGRKKIADIGTVEKVVERRQRRMIKNRESAARSRARKQAYTVELEAELNQLKEENKQLKQALAELERKRKQQYLEEMRMKTQTQTKAHKAKERLRMMRRNLSCPL